MEHVVKSIDVQGHVADAGQAQILLMEAVACGLVALPHAAACLLGGKISPWAAVLLGRMCCPIAAAEHAPSGNFMMGLMP